MKNRGHLLMLFIVMGLQIANSGGVFAGIDPVKLMSYNLLNYPQTAGGSITADTTLRNPHFRTIVTAVNPDIMVVGEMISQTGVNTFLSNVMNKALTGFAAGVFIDGFDTDNAIFYRTSKFAFISNTRIFTELRDINEFKLRHLLSGDTIRIYALHLKASDSAPERAQRAREVDSLRKVTNALPLGCNFVVCGDFNIYNDSESAYLKLKQVIVGTEGHFIDPLNMTGTWNQAGYAPYHTQSTRISSFGGGSTAGMNDRFDMILYSKALSIAGSVDYSGGSLIAYGNDGLHFDDSINRPPNNAVSANVANALHLASDHIPVIATLNFNYTSTATNDFGIQALQTPSSAICPSSAQSLQVIIKNYGAATVDFSSTNLPIELKVTNPSATIQTFNKTITSGTITSGSTLIVTFDTALDMSLAGAYSFKSYTQVNQDINHNNDTNVTQVNVYSVNTPVISPAGPITICNSSPVTLTSSSATSYSWSSGSSAKSIVVNATGNYIVTVTDAHGCTTTSAPVVVTADSFRVSGIIYQESFGLPVGSNAINVNTYTGWRNSPPITYSSTTPTPSDVRKTNPYSLVNNNDTGNVFMGTSTNAARNLIISGINTIGFQNLQLSFALRRESSGTDSFIVEYSSNNGVSFAPFTFTQLSISNAWVMVKATTTSNIPEVANLIIRFSKNSTNTQFRIDDVSLTYNYYAPVITASAATTFCNGGSVTLNSSTASGYNWSNGLSTRNINVTTSGNYSVVQTSANGCTAISNVINVTVNPIVNPQVSINANVSGSVCAGTPVTFTASPVNGGTSPVYNFKVNNISKQNGSAFVFTTSLLANNDSVTCEMSSNANCANPVVAISNKYYAVVTQPPTWYLDSDQDGYYINGSAVSQCISPGQGYNISIIGGGDCNDSISAIHPGTAEVCGNGTDDNCNGQIDEACSITLNIKLFIEGFYIGNGMMIMGDTITVTLHEAFTPFNSLHAVTGYITEFGLGSFSFPSSFLNGTYFIAVKGRNSVETWCKTPVNINSNLINYDFSKP